MRKFWSLGSIFWVLSFGSGAYGQSPFPLETGTVWRYQGTQTCYNTQASKETPQPLSLQMEVLQSTKIGTITIAEVRGGFLDPECGEKLQPSTYLFILKDQTKLYYSVRRAGNTDPVAAVETFAGLTDILRKNGGRFALVQKNFELLLNMNPIRAKRFASKRYDWSVESSTPIQLENIKGSGTQAKTGYLLAQRDNTGFFELIFVPNLGFCKLRYHHNGSTNDFDLGLVEYHP
ncbi:MAG: hypothetical protein H7Y37_03245 [Anaerolineae bacterium]|nr:hypothetical protein [Gloeobacterales cyanobacterium ES-bin-313]